MTRSHTYIQLDTASYRLRTNQFHNPRTPRVLTFLESPSSQMMMTRWGLEAWMRPRGSSRPLLCERKPWISMERYDSNSLISPTVYTITCICLTSPLSLFLILSFSLSFSFFSLCPLRSLYPPSLSMLLSYPIHLIISLCFSFSFRLSALLPRNPKPRTCEASQMRVQQQSPHKPKH